MKTACGKTRCTHRAFSLVDLLVSLTVIVVLMGLLLPSIAGIREAARRVACSSNVRQFGLGLAMYAQDNKEGLPLSAYAAYKAGDPEARPELMMSVRLADNDAWDSLGVLFISGYTPAAGVYYCPSHTGEHPYSSSQNAWSTGTGEIIGNYHFRGVTSGGSNLITAFGRGSALISDGLATQLDYNHKTGNNALRADFSVLWVQDVQGQIAGVLPKATGDLTAPLRVRVAWQEIDRAAGANPATSDAQGDNPPPL